MTGKLLLIVIVLAEVWGLTAFGIKNVPKTLIYYTQISNLTAMISALLLLVIGPKPWILTLRYLSVCMLVMTFIVVICVLLPMLRNTEMLLTSRSGFFMHVVCPVLNVISYLFFELYPRSTWIFLPPAVTLVYGVIMMYMNYIGKVDGPYPFFRVRNQSVLATILWIIVLFGAVYLISIGVYRLSI